MNRNHPRPRKVLTLPSHMAFINKTPTLYFRVQAIFQNNGIVLIDLKSGKPITGQIAIENIGLVDSNKPHHTKRSTGFIQQTENLGENYFQTDVDAVLSFNGVAENQIPIFVLRVVDGRELNKWQDLVYSVVQNFSVRDRGQRLIPFINFEITALTNPDEADPHSAIEAVLMRFQEYGFHGRNAYSKSRLKTTPDDLNENK